MTGCEVLRQLLAADLACSVYNRPWIGRNLLYNGPSETSKLDLAFSLVDAGATSATYKLCLSSAQVHTMYHCPRVSKSINSRGKVGLELCRIVM